MLATQRLTVRTSHVEFRVLMTLAEHADRVGTHAWPGINTIADEAQMERKTVWKCLQSLQILGLITGEKGRGRSNTTVWTLAFMVQDTLLIGVTGTPIEPVKGVPTPPLVEYDEGVKGVPQTPIGVHQTPFRVVKGVPQTPEPSKKERKEESSLRSLTRKRVRENTKALASSTASSTENGFETFWESYPRKVGKGAARKAYTSAIGRGADPVEVLAAIGQQRWSPEVQYRPHASTWLNADRWLDDPEAAAPLPAPPGPSAAMLRIQQRDHDLRIIAGRIPGNDDDLFIPNMQTRFLQ